MSNDKNKTTSSGQQRVKISIGNALKQARNEALLVLHYYETGEDYYETLRREQQREHRKKVLKLLQKEQNKLDTKLDIAHQEAEFQRGSNNNVSKDTTVVSTTDVAHSENTQKPKSKTLGEILQNQLDWYNNFVGLLKSANSQLKSKDKPLSTPMQQQREDAVEYISMEAENQFDDRIAELEYQKKQLLNLIKSLLILLLKELFNNNPISLPTFYTNQYSILNGNQAGQDKTVVYEGRLSRVEQELKNLKFMRSQYVSTMEALTDPVKRLNTVLRNRFEESDAYVKLNAAAVSAESDANRVKLASGWGTSAPEYRDALSKWYQAYQNKRDIDRKFADLQAYIQKIGYIPRMSEIPDRLKDIAKQAFTKDGKNLLDDENEIDKLSADRVVFKNEFGKISKAVSDHLNTFSMSTEQIDDQMRRIEMLKEYNLSQKPFGQRALYSGKSLVVDESYDAALDLLRDAKRHKEINEQVLDARESLGKGGITYTSLIGGLEYAKRRIVDDVLGITDREGRELSNVYIAQKKLSEGKDLTEGDKAVLEAKAIEDLYGGLYGNYKDERGYKWGQITAESLEYMAQFLISGGAYSAAKGGVEKGVRKASIAMAKNMLKQGNKAAAYMGDVAAGLAEPAVADAYRLNATNEARKAMAEFLLAKYGPVKTGTKLLEISGRLGIDAAYAAALENTLGLPKVMKDAYRDSLGQINMGVDFAGNSYVDSVKDVKDFSDSLRTSEIRNWIENYSEMMGEWGIGKGIKYAASKIPKLGKVLRAMDLGFKRNALHDLLTYTKEYLQKGLLAQNEMLMRKGGWKNLQSMLPKPDELFNSRVLRNGQFHGFFGEVAEEYYGLLLQHALGVQDDKYKTGKWGLDLWKDIQDQSVDIWGGIALSSGLLGGLSMGSSVFLQQQYRNAEQNLVNAFGKDFADNIRRQLLFAHNYDIADTYIALSAAYDKPSDKNGVTKLKDFLNIGGKNKSKADALRDYFDALLQLRGAVYGEDAVKYQMGVDNWRLNTEAREAGYRAGTYRARKQAEAVANLLREDVNKSMTDAGMFDSERKSIDDILNGVTSDTQSSEKVGISEFIKNVMDEIPGFRMRRRQYDQYGNIENGDDITESLIASPDETDEQRLKREADIKTARDLKINLIKKVVAYNNALSHMLATDFTLDKLVTDRAKSYSRRAGRLLNVNDLKLHPITKTVVRKNEKGEEKNVKTTLFLIDGDIKQSAIEGERGKVYLENGVYDSPYVLVANYDGEFALLDRKELEGWDVEDPITVASKNEDTGRITIEQYKQDMEDSVIEKEWDQRQDYLKNLTSQLDRYKVLQNGESLNLANGKKVTVLDANPRNNDIVFSVQNRNGSSAQIFRAKSFDDFKTKVENIEKSADENGNTVEDITKLFLDQAEDQTRSYINNRVAEVIEQEREGYQRYLAIKQVNAARKELQEQLLELEESLELQKEETPKETNVEEEASGPELEQPKTPANGTTDIVYNPDYTFISKKDVKDRAKRINKIRKQRLKEEKRRAKEGTAITETVEPTVIEPTDELSGPVAIVEGEEIHLIGAAFSGNEIPKGTTAIGGGTIVIGGGTSDSLLTLKDEVKAQQRKKLGTSSYHYFVDEGGEIALYRRVHSEQTDQYERTVTNPNLAKEIYSTIKNQGVDALVNLIDRKKQLIIEQYIRDPETSGESDEYKNRLKEAVSAIVDGSVNIHMYLKYISLYIEDGKIKQGSEYYVYEAAIGISNCIPNVLTLDKRGRQRLKEWQSVEAGDIYDTINRYVFNYGSTFEDVLDIYRGPNAVDVGISVDDPQHTKVPQMSAMTTLYGGKEVPINQILDEDVFVAITKQMFKFKERLESNGWRLYSEVPMFLTATLATKDESSPGGIRVVKVAGETDCVAINSAGERILIDFKTYRNDKKLYGGLNSDFYKVGDLQNHSTAAQYYQQFWFYNLLASLNGEQFAARYAFLFGITYGSQGKISLSIDSEKLSESKFMQDEEPVLERLDESTQDKDAGVHAMHERLVDKYESTGSISDINKEYLRYVSQFDIDNLIRLYEQVRAIRAAFAIFGQKSSMSETIDGVVDTVKEQIDDFVSMFNNIIYYDLSGAVIDQNEDVLARFANDIDTNDDEESDARQSLKLLANIMYVIKQGGGLFDNSSMQQFVDVANAITSKSRKVESLYNAYWEQVDKHVSDSLNTSEKDLQRTPNLNNSAENVRPYTVDSSVSADGRKLEDVIGMPDFITNSEFYVQRMKVDAFKELQYGVIIKYDGIEYSPVLINFPPGNQILHHMSTLFDSVKEGERLRFKNDLFFRSFGHFNNTTGEKLLDPAKDLAFNEQLSLVRYSSTGNICITRGISVDGKIVVVAQKPTGRDGKRETVFTYSGTSDRTKPSVGTFVYMYNPGYEEMQQDLGSNTDQNSVPVNLIASRITEQLASFVVNYLYGEKPGDNENENATTSSGFFKSQVANLFISIGTPETKIGVKPPVYIDRVYGGDGTVVGYKLVGKIKDDNDLPIDSERIYRLDSTKDKEDLIKALQNVKINLNELVMQESVGIDGMSTIGSMIKNNKDVGELIANIRQNGSAELDDGLGVSLHDGDMEMSVIAWYMKNGLITSEFRGFESVPVYINDFGIDDEKDLLYQSTEEISEEGVDVVAAGEEGEPGDNDGAEEFSMSDEDLADMTAGIEEAQIHKTRFVSDQTIEAGEALDLQQAKEDFFKIAGKIDFVTPEDERYQQIAERDKLGVILDEVVINTLGGHMKNGVVVAALYSDMVVFTKFARLGDQYHEAFHRVLEVLVSEKLREKAYAEYRKRFEKRGDQIPTDRQIAEIAADEFAYFMQKRPHFKWSWNVLKMLKTIGAYYKFYRSIDSFTLWKLYKNAERGKYAKFKPSPDAIARFEKFAQTEHSKKAFLASVINSRQLAGLTEFINSVVISKSTYASANKLLDVDLSHGANLTIEDIINAPLVKQLFVDKNISDSTRKRLMEFLGIKASESGKPLFKNGKFVLIDGKEGVEARLKLQAIIDSAVIQMQAFQMSTKTNIEKIEREDKLKDLKKKKNNEKNVDVISEEESERTSGAIAKGEYEKVSYEFEPIVRASARVKFFFSSILDMEYQEIYDIDSATSKGRIAVYKLNDAGLPRMLDYKMAWSRVINRLYDIDTTQDLLDQLEARRHNNYMFDQLYQKFLELMKQAFEYDTDERGLFKEFKKDENGLFITKDIDKQNDVAGIVSSVSLQKTPPQVAKSHQSDKEDSKDKFIEIFDADENATIHSLKNDWSAAFASGALPVMKRVVKDGKIKLEPNAIAIDDIMKWFSSLNNLFGGSKKVKNPYVTYSHILHKAKLTKNGKFVSLGETISQERRLVYSGNKFVVQYKDGNTWKTAEKNGAVTNADVKSLMVEFTKRLNNVGIMVSYEDIDWLVDNMFCVNDRHAFIPDKFERFRRFAKENAGQLFGNFNTNLQRVKNYTQDSNFSPEFIWMNSTKYGFEYSGLIDVLAKGRYDRIADDYQSSHLTINGKKQYDFGERNFIYDRLRFILRVNSDEYRNMIRNPYYAYKNAIGQQEGSIVFKQLSTAFAEKNIGTVSLFYFRNIPGMKTDAQGDSGIEYLDLSEIEDYMLKYSILLKNGILLPTLSDKTTYGAIYGISKAFGFDWVRSLYEDAEGKKDSIGYSQFEDEFNKGHYKIDGVANYNFSPNPGQILDGAIKQVIQTRLSDDVLRQFIEYAKSEYISARYELARIKSIDGVKEEDKVNRFHKGKKSDGHVVVLGARMSTFSGIFKFNDQTGNYDFVSFNRIKDANGNWVSEEANLQVAEREFFSKSPELLLEIMNSVLCYQIQKELDKLEEIGAISKNENGCYRNIEFLRKPLGKAQFAIHKYYNRSEDGYVYRDDISDNETDKNNSHSRSLVLLVSDLVCKSQMSLQESLRIYSGNLAYFKWEYDSYGIVKDMTTDFFKRLGGLVSTGSHNVEDIPGVKKKLRCAEIVDEMIDLDFQEEFRKRAPIQTYKKYLRDELLSVRGIKIENSDKYKHEIEQVYESVDKINSVDDLKKAIRKVVKDKRKSDNVNENEIDVELDGIFSTLDSVLKSQTNALGPDEDGEYPGSTVNDGATYISDETCKMLLISLGKFNGKVKEAFELLTSNKYKDVSNQELELEDAIAVADAYNTITTEVIGTQKYMAYGQRFVDIDDDSTVELMLDDKTTIENKLLYSECESYYDKPAFFPLFKCIASGHQLAVLEKMKSEEIDVLKVTGATKVGNKGAVKCDKDTFKQWDENTKAYDDFKLNAYEQNFRDFRKQFNTDPKGTEFMTLGTQYQKVVLSLISADEVYTVDGKKLSAKETRDQIMEAFNKYLDARNDRFKERFYTNGQVDAEKLKTIMKSEISRMEASDPVANAFDIEEVEVDGKKVKRFVMPIAAMSNTNWLQSVVASVVNKDLIDVVMPGNAFYQRSAFMMEGQMSDTLNERLGRKKLAKYIINGQEIKGNSRWAINHGMPLLEENEEKSMDIVLSIDFFDYIFNEHPELKYQSFDAKRDWLIKNGIISGFSKNQEPFVPKKGDSYIDANGDIVNVEEDQTEEITARRWHNAKAQIVGYRIPTQAVSSIHALRCVDVIPVVRDTIILPKGITAITGSDFDIDKFFLSTLYYKQMFDELFEEELSNVDLNLEFDGKDDDDYYTYKDSDGIVHNVKKDGEKYIDKFKRKVGKKWEKVEIEIGSNLQQIRKRLYTNSQMRQEHMWLSADDFDPETEGDKYYGNRLINLLLNLLKRTDNNLSKLHGAIDSDTEPLKEIAKKLEKKKKGSFSAPFDATSLVTNVTSKMSFAIGKKGIGPYALNNNNHVLTYLYNVAFAQEFDKNGHPIGILDVLGLRRLDRLTGNDGRLILSWLSGLINAHVDVAKDPYIRSLGVNSYTYNLVSLLIRTGYGYNTFWFTTQPVMEKLYNIYDRASGVYNQQEDLTQSQRQLTKINDYYTDVLSQIIGKDYSRKDSAIEDFKEWLKRTYFSGLEQSATSAYNEMVVLLMNGKHGQSVLEEIATTPEDDIKEFYDIGLSHGGQNIPVSYKAIQGLILAINDQLLKKAEGLSKLVLYTKIDTKKLGITVNELRSYYENWQDLTDERRSQFEPEGIAKMVGLKPDDPNNTEIYSFVGYKTETAIKEYLRLLSGQIFEATEMFEEIFNSVRNFLNIQYLGGDSRKSISRMIVAKLKADYFVKGKNCYCVKANIDPVELIGNSDKSIAYKLLDIKSKILDLNNHDFDELRNDDGLCNNYLLNNLIVDKSVDEHTLYGKDSQDGLYVDSWEGAQFVRPLSIFEDSLKSSDMQNAWRDLLTSSNSDVRRFANELVVYAFMTSAELGGKYDLFKFVPPSWRIGQFQDMHDINMPSYSEYIYTKLDQLQHGDESANLTILDIEGMVLDFYWDDNIIPTMDSSRLKSSTRLESGGLKTGIIAGVSPSGKLMFKDETAPTFFKIRNPRLAGQGSYDIYQIFGYGTKQITKDNKTTVVTFPLYGKIPPTGGKYPGGQKIFQMGMGSAIKDYEFRKRFMSENYSGILNQLELNNVGISTAKSIRDLNVRMFLNTILTETVSVLGRDVPLLGQLFTGIVNENIQIPEEIQVPTVSTSAARLPYWDAYLQLMNTPIDYTRDSAVDISTAQRVDIFSEMNDLRLDEEFKDVYSKYNDSDDIPMFLYDAKFIESAEQFGINVEFYKKRFISENDGKQYWKPVAVVSIKNHKNFGFLELVSEIDETKSGSDMYTGEYSVEFNAFFNKKGLGPFKKEFANFVKFDLSDSQKRLLLNGLVGIIKDGSKFNVSESMQSDEFDNLISVADVRFGRFESVDDNLSQYIKRTYKDYKKAITYFSRQPSLVNALKLFALPSHEFKTAWGNLNEQQKQDAERMVKGGIDELIKFISSGYISQGLGKIILSNLTSLNSTDNTVEQSLAEKSSFDAELKRKQQEAVDDAVKLTVKMCNLVNPF